MVNSAKVIAEENPGTEGGLSPVHFLYCSSAVSIIYRNACVCEICVGQAKLRFCNEGFQQELAFSLYPIQGPD